MAANTDIASTLIGFPAGDIAGRLIVRESVVLGPADGDLVLAANPARIAVMFSSSSAGAVLVSRRQLGVNGTGLLMPSNAFISLTLRDHGPIVQGEFWQSFTGVGANYHIWETILVKNEPTVFSRPAPARVSSNIREDLIRAIRRILHNR